MLRFTRLTLALLVLGSAVTMAASDVRDEKSKLLKAVRRIAPEEVARRVVRGIDRKDLYILTHPEQREFLRRRAAKLDAMFEEDTW